MKKLAGSYFFIITTIFLFSCKKQSTENGPLTDFIRATVDGVNYNSNDVVAVTEPSTGELSFFYSLSADSTGIGLLVNPTLPAYAEGTYNFRPSSPEGVLIVSFRVLEVNSRQELQWVTANETNLDYAVIESSQDGRNFNQIGIVDAIGNTTDNTTYNYMDTVKWFVTQTYYRLKMVNNDGSFVYSMVLSYRQSMAGNYYKDLVGRYKGYNGTITISNHNRAAKVVTGTFSFDVKDYGNNIKQIRNGSFRVSY